jgi:MYXO-CTERM domain-containing protein
VRALDDQRVELELVEVLSHRLLTPIGPGDVLAGSFDGKLACGGQANVTIGSEVLAFWQGPFTDPAPECAAYATCRREHCGLFQNSPLSAADEWRTCDADCSRATHAACIEQPRDALLRGDVRLVPWTDPLSFGSEDSLPAQDALLLLDRNTCNDVLFPVTQPACNDVVRQEVRSCAVASPGHPRRSTALAGLGLLLAALALRRRASL